MYYIAIIPVRTLINFMRIPCAPKFAQRPRQQHVDCQIPSISPRRSTRSRRNGMHRCLTPRIAPRGYGGSPGLTRNAITKHIRGQPHPSVISPPHPSSPPLRHPRERPALDPIGGGDPGPRLHNPPNPSSPRNDPISKHTPSQHTSRRPTHHTRPPVIPAKAGTQAPVSITHHTRPTSHPHFPPPHPSCPPPPSSPRKACPRPDWGRGPSKPSPPKANPRPQRPPKAV